MNVIDYLNKDKKDLLKKIRQYNTILYSNKYHDMLEEEKFLLDEQGDIMNNYLDIINKRIDLYK